MVLSAQLIAQDFNVEHRFEYVPNSHLSDVTVAEMAEAYRLLADSDRKRRKTRLKIWASVAAIVGSMNTFVLPNVLASGTPNVTLTKTAPAEVLLGDNATVTLKACNPSGTNGYNVAFRDVLPAGVAIAASTPAPSKTTAGPGATTIVTWKNVSDLVASQCSTITYSVSASPTTLPVGSIYTNSARAYVQSDPSLVPNPDDPTKFDANGVPTTSTGSGSASGYSALATASTQVIAFRVTKTGGPSLRGVHDWTTGYTITVTNNKVNPTNNVLIDDWLTDDVEFLGCNGADHTGNAPTNVGVSLEYPGAPAMVPGSCTAPTLVETRSAPGIGVPVSLAPGVYTHVLWASLGNLAAGASIALNVKTGIPLRRNTMDWNGTASGNGTAPATTGAQAANLDNNSGAEAGAGESTTNTVIGTGTYTGPRVGAILATHSKSAVATNNAKDLALTNTVEEGNSAFLQGNVLHWVLTIDTSEYRTFTDLEVHDTIPNGLCVLGAANYEPTGTPAECDPTGEVPQFRFGTSGPWTDIDYASVTPISGGTYDVVFDKTATGLATAFGDTIRNPGALSGAGLGSSNSAVQIRIPTKVRRYYQTGNHNDNTSSPVLAKDLISNTATVDGVAHMRLDTNGNPLNGDRLRVEPLGTHITSAGASTEAPGVTFDKQVARTSSSGVCPTDDASFSNSHNAYVPIGGSSPFYAPAMSSVGASGPRSRSAMTPERWASTTSFPSATSTSPERPPRHRSIPPGHGH